MKKILIIFALVIINVLLCKASENVLHDTLFLQEPDSIIKQNHILQAKSLSSDEWDILIEQLYQKKMNGTYKSTDYDYIVYNGILADFLEYQYNQLNDYRFAPDLISKIMFLVKEDEE